MVCFPIEFAKATILWISGAPDDEYMETFDVLPLIIVKGSHDTWTDDWVWRDGATLTSRVVDFILFS
jgi:hypothetical protein